MGDIERAILISFDQSGAASADLRAQADAFLRALKQSPAAWQYFVQGFQSTGIAEVKFWYIQALLEYLQQSTEQLPSDACQNIRQALLSWYRGGHHLPPYLRNKVAQALALLGGRHFPSVWPSFVGDVLDGRCGNIDHADMLCRLLRALDDDVISVEVPRNQEESKRSMRFKDALRDGPINDILDACYRIGVTHRVSAHHVAADVLVTVQRYISWIDQQLVVNNKWLPFLFGCIPQQQGVDGALRAAAADVITQIVNKRTDAVPKLQLLQQLDVGLLCTAWYATWQTVPSQQFSTQLHGEVDDEAALQLSRTLVAICQEALEASKKVENSVVGLLAVGLSVDEDAVKEAQGALEGAGALLERMFPLMLDMLLVNTPDGQLAAVPVPFLLNYVSRVRAQQKRGRQPSQTQVELLRRLLTALSRCAAYPNPSACQADLPSSSGAAVAVEEEEAAVADKRQDLMTLFKNVSKIMPHDALAFVRQQLNGVLAPASSGAPWQDVEVAVMLLHKIGEHQVDNTISAGDLQSLVQLLLRGHPPVPHTEHRLVALAVLECLTRYAKLLENDLSRVVSLFLGPCGIGHPAASVSVRAYYLMNRLVRTMKQALRPHVAPLIRQLQPHLAVLAGSPPPPRPPAGSFTAGSVTQGPPSAKAAARVLPVDDRLYGYEVAGVLLGQDTLSEGEQVELLQELASPLMMQLQSAANAVQSPRAGAAARMTAAALTQHVCDAITRLAKGFDEDQCVRARPQLGQILQQLLAQAVTIVGQLHTSKAVRWRFISLLHRMTETLGTSLLPLLPTALEALLRDENDAGDCADTLSLLSQLVLKFNAKMQPLLQRVFPVCLQQVDRQLCGYVGWQGETLKQGPPGPGSGSSGEDVRERWQLQRAYFLLLLSMVNNGLAQLLLSAPADMLHALLEGVCLAAAGHKDVGTRKVCLQVMHQLLRCYQDTNGNAPQEQQQPPQQHGYQQQGPQQHGPHQQPPQLQGFVAYARRFVVHDVLQRGVLQGGGQSRLDLQDASTMTYLTEVASVLEMLHATHAQELAAELAAAAVCGREQLISSLKVDDVKQTRNVIRDLAVAAQ